MNKLKVNGNVSGSFRDPSGFLFYQDRLLYRQINSAYKKEYDRLMASGLYKSLTDTGLLIPHEETALGTILSDKAYKIIKPRPLPFISYPYEWCFSQLKDAAITTLQIAKKALDFGMSLKDCSAYNIQFHKGKPIFIDTLSFEEYREGEPWVAYRQFCQHFLAPLALMSYKDIRLNQLLRIYIDGIPLDLASSLLPLKTHFIFPLLIHVHLHSKAQKHYAAKDVKKRRGSVSRLSFMGLLDSLEAAVRKLKWEPKGTEWGDYYEDTNYSKEALESKAQVVCDFLEKCNPKTVWDLGANTGMFSRINGNKEISVIAFDIDPAAVERNYLQCVKKNDTQTLPLLLDLTNPSPGIGWENKERMSLSHRGPADTVLALALIHHLAISNNLPFEKIADFFGKICDSLIIEFVPKKDSKVQRLLSTRQDIFPDYTQQSFECAFKKTFSMQDCLKVKNSQRSLYLMKKA